MTSNLRIQTSYTFKILLINFYSYPWVVKVKKPPLGEVFLLNIKHFIPSFSSRYQLVIDVARLTQPEQFPLRNSLPGIINLNSMAMLYDVCPKPKTDRNATSQLEKSRKNRSQTNSIFARYGVVFKNKWFFAQRAELFNL